MGTKVYNNLPGFTNSVINMGTKVYNNLPGFTNSVINMGTKVYNNLHGFTKEMDDYEALMKELKLILLF